VLLYEVDDAACRLAEATVAVRRKEYTDQGHHEVKFLHFEVTVAAAKFVLIEEVHHVLKAALSEEGLGPIQS
jgi:hypothetical protein